MSRRRKAVFKDPEQELERRGRPPALRTTLTDEMVSAMVATEAEQSVHDDEVRGLFVRIRPAGSKTYYFRQPGIGNKHAINLGSADTRSIADARAEAARLERNRAERRISRFSSGGPSKWTVARAFDAYLGTKTPSTWSRRIERTFRKTILPVIGHVKLTELDGDTALSPFTELDGYYRAGTPHYMLSAFLTWATFSGHVKFNVLRGRASLPHRPLSKHRTLSAHEIGLFWRACDQLPAQWCIAFRLMIASGRSIAEVLSLRSDAAGNWPADTDTEYGRRGAVINDLLSQAGIGKVGYIFVANGKRQPRAFQQRYWNALREAAGLERATMSDMRNGIDRQFATCRGDLTKWDDFLRTCMAESIDVEEVDL